MFLTISTETENATDLGWVMHKHPERPQQFSLSYGTAHVFYPEASDTKCTVALVLEVDPVKLVRSGGSWDAPLQQYVNDRPFVTSSFMTVAIGQVFGTALAGNCKQRPELPDREFPLVCTLGVVASFGGESLFRKLFEPLGYDVTVSKHDAPTTEAIQVRSNHYRIELTGEVTIQTLLQHLCVLIPVLDGQKHYFINQDEVEKLLRRGESWLGEHPEKELISQRYLKRRRGLVRTVLERLKDVEDDESEAVEEPVVKPKRLNTIRHETVVEKLLMNGVKTVVDLGCSEGRLSERLLKKSQIEKVIAVDVSNEALVRARRRLKLDRFPNPKVEVLHGSMSYYDARLDHADGFAIVEVIEHLDPWRLKTFEKVVFGGNQPRIAVVTTPNGEYNALFEGMAEGAMRHRDHRFEWDRQTFKNWCERIAETFGYTFDVFPVGEVDAQFGAPTQGVTFTKAGGTP